MFSWGEAQKGRKEGKYAPNQDFFSLSRLLSVYLSFYSTGILQQLLKLHKDEDWKEDFAFCLHD